MARAPVHRFTLLWAAAVVSVFVSDHAGAEHQTGPSAASSLSGQIVEMDGRTAVPFALVALDPGPVQRQPLVAGDDGRFRFEGLTAGSFGLSAYKPGYAATTYAPRDSSDIAEPIVVKTGQHLEGLALRLPRGAAVSGRITNEFGEPSVGAVVTIKREPAAANPALRPFQYINKLSERTSQLSTDANGWFRFYDLVAGTYVVSTAGQYESTWRAGSSDSPRMGYQRVYFPGVADESRATRIAVAAGEDRSGVDMTLVVSGLARLEGRILGVPEERRVSIWLDGRNPAGAVEFVPAERGSQFSVPNVFPGEYLLTAYVGPGGRQPNGEPGPPALWAAGRVTVTADAANQVTLRLERTMSASGRVVRADATGAADLGGYCVTLTPTDPRAFGRLLSSSRLSESNQFSAGNLPPGRYRFAVPRCQGPGAATVVTVTVGGRALSDAEIEIAAGGDVTGVEIRVRGSGLFSTDPVISVPGLERQSVRGLAPK